MSTAKILKQLKVVDDLDSKIATEKDKLCALLQPLVNFKVYVTVFADDGVAVMSSEESVGMSIKMFLDLLAKHKNKFTEEVFMEYASL